MDSKLQVISGRFRGMGIKFPASARPTAQRARGAVFNMLASLFQAEFSTDKWVVWDAFAGSGAMGIEFFSRFGADGVIWSDKSAEAVAVIRENIQKLQDIKAVIRRAEAGKIIGEVVGAARSAHDRLIVFIDPPYSDADAGTELMGKLTPYAPEGTIVVWERENSSEFRVQSSELSEHWEVLRERTHGRAKFLILQKKTKAKLSPEEEGNEEIGSDEQDAAADEEEVNIEDVARRFVVDLEQIPGGGKYKTIAAAAPAIVAKVYPTLDVAALMAAMYRAKQR